MRCGTRKNLEYGNKVQAMVVRKYVKLLWERVQLDEVSNTYFTLKFII